MQNEWWYPFILAPLDTQRRAGSFALDVNLGTLLHDFPKVARSLPG